MQPLLYHPISDLVTLRIDSKAKEGFQKNTIAVVKSVAMWISKGASNDDFPRRHQAAPYWKQRVIRQTVVMIDKDLNVRIEYCLRRQTIYHIISWTDNGYSSHDSGMKAFTGSFQRQNQIRIGGRTRRIGDHVNHRILKDSTYDFSAGMIFVIPCRTYCFCHLPRGFC